MVTTDLCLACAFQGLTDSGEELQCPKCGLQMAKSAQTLDYRAEYSDAASMYAEHFAAIDRIQGRRVPTSRLLPFEGQILSTLRSDPRVRSLVDVGCGTGRLLRAAESTGVSALGYEIVPEICARLSSFGRQVRQGGYDDFVRSSEGTDAVAMLEVLEHLPQPREAVQSILAAKRPQYFFIVVPDHVQRRRFDTNFRIHDVPPNHLTWWNERALAAVLQHPGYSISVARVSELRWSIVRNIVRGDLSTSGTSFPDWVSAVVSPPSFWFLGVACRN